MPMEHIDTVIQQVIADLRQKDQALGDRYEQAVRDGTFKGRMRNSPSSPSGVEVAEASDEIIRRLKLIDGWYVKCNEIGVWNRVRTESPDLINELLNLRDGIDAHFERWKNGFGGWGEVEKTILDYVGLWRKIYKACQ